MARVPREVLRRALGLLGVTVRRVKEQPAVKQQTRHAGKRPKATPDPAEIAATERVAWPVLAPLAGALVVYMGPRGARPRTRSGRTSVQRWRQGNCALEERRIRALVKPDADDESSDAGPMRRELVPFLCHLC
jgi:hypothetical protein